MRTNKNGEIIKFLVTDSGIRQITDSDGRFNWEKGLPAFETFEEAALLYMDILNDRITELEKRNK